MNELINTSSWIQPLGWALFHSLWIGAFLTLFALTVLRFIPLQHSGSRYNVSVAGLFTLLLITTGIFLFTIDSTSTTVKPLAFVNRALNPEHLPLLDTTSWLSVVKASVQTQLDNVVLFWFGGVLFFLLRLLGSWWYVNKLIRVATPIGPEWTEKLADLCHRLSIRKLIRLWESTSVQAPVVIGFVKPAILVPVGLLNGLTAEEVETILLHELMHVKRNDYLINLFQSIAETLLFFNPFVWILSSWARKEREHCCDDGVLAFKGNALAYAYALTRLEEVRLSRSPLVLSLAGEKNQLFNRVKRFMEKSSKNYSNHGKVIPLVFLLIGLVCASFFTLQQKPSKSRIENPAKKEGIAASDTTIKKQKSATYSKKKQTVVGEDGKHHEEVTEKFEGDEDLRPLLENWAFTMPPMPVIAFSPDMVAELEELNTLENLTAIPPVPFFDLYLDTLPGPRFRYDAKIRYNEKEWKEFSLEFEKNFREHFGEFYKKNEREFENMMKEMEEKFKKQYDYHLTFPHEEWQKHQQEWQKNQEEWQKHQQEALSKFHQNESWKKLEESMQEMSKWKQNQALRFREMEENMRQMQENMSHLERNMKAFQEAVNVQLIKDGYIKEGEKIRSMNFSDDGEIEVNGIKIKPADKAKYKEIQLRYLKDRGNFRYSE